MNNKKTPYDVLGVDRFSSQKEIRRRYLELCKTHHPDIAGSSSKVDFREITVAYDLLVNKKHQIMRNTTASTATYQNPINTKLWTNRSYLLGFGILTLTFIYFYDTSPKQPLRVLPHELIHRESPPIDLSRDNESTTIKPWEAAGLSYREWRKK